jgi:hypothetical protein
MFVGAHVTDGKAGFHFAGDAGFLEAHDALFRFANAQQQNAGRARLAVQFQFVAGNQGDAAPGEKWRAK